MTCARAQLPGAEEGGQLVGVQPGRVGHRAGSSLGVRPGAGRPSLAADDRRDDDEPVALLGGVREGRLDRQRRRHDIVAEDVLELDRLGGRRDRVGVELGQLGVLIEDVVELAFEPVSSWSVSPSRARWATWATSSRVRPAMAAMIAATIGPWPRRTRIRPMRSDDVDPAAEVMSRRRLG